MGDSKNGWFVMENPVSTHDLEVPASALVRQETEDAVQKPEWMSPVAQKLGDNSSRNTKDLTRPNEEANTWLRAPRRGVFSRCRRLKAYLGR